MSEVYTAVLTTGSPQFKGSAAVQGNFPSGWSTYRTIAPRPDGSFRLDVPVGREVRMVVRRSWPWDSFEPVSFGPGTPNAVEEKALGEPIARHTPGTASPGVTPVAAPAPSTFSATKSRGQLQVSVAKLRSPLNVPMDKEGFTPSVTWTFGNARTSSNLWFANDSTGVDGLTSLKTGIGTVSVTIKDSADALNSATFSRSFVEFDQDYTKHISKTVVTGEESFVEASVRLPAGHTSTLAIVGQWEQIGGPKVTMPPAEEVTLGAATAGGAGAEYVSRFTFTPVAPGSTQVTYAFQYRITVPSLGYSDTRHYQTVTAWPSKAKGAKYYASELVSNRVPFAASSPAFHKPADLPLHPDQAAATASFKTNLTSGGKLVAPVLNAFNFTQGSFVAKADTPRRTVKFGDRQVKGKPDNNMFGGTQIFMNVPIPYEAAAAPGADGHVRIYDPITDTLYEFWKFWRTPPTAEEPEGGYEATWGGRIDNVSQSIGQYPHPYGVAACGLAWDLGALLIEEVKAGVAKIKAGQEPSGIRDRNLYMAIPRPASAFSWPANRHDGWISTTTEPAAIREGQLISTTLTPAEILAADAHPVGKFVWYCIATCGLRIMDKTSSAANIGCESGLPLQMATGVNPWETLFDRASYPGLGTYNILNLPSALAMHDKWVVHAIDAGKPAA